jgi:hypothetical protein
MNFNDKQETEGRIIKRYPRPSDHNTIIATRFALFERRVDPSTLQKNGLVCGFLPSLKKSYRLIKKHLETVIKMGNQGVEAIFNKIRRNTRGELITYNSTTRVMARLGTSNKPMKGCIPMEAKLVALYRTDIFTKKDFYF